MIVLVDLDNTLVDRELAFRTRARHFIDEISADPEDLAWLLATDADGYTPRADLAGALQERWGLSIRVEDLVQRLVLELAQHIQPYPGVRSALEALTATGVTLVVVTNGTAAQQQRKMQRSGLASLISDVVISEAVGSKKPDPLIFRTALETAGRHGGRGQAWMVGDHPLADIAGAKNCGLLTGWVSHDRLWTTGQPADIAGPRTVDVLAQMTPPKSR